MKLRLRSTIVNLGVWIAPITRAASQKPRSVRVADGRRTGIGVVRTYTFGIQNI